MSNTDPIRVSTYLDLATKILTDKQLQVLEAKLAGHSWNTIALNMQLDEATVRGHHRRAIARLRKAQRKEAA